MSDRKFAMTSEWMVNGNINEFIKAHKDADRFELVGYNFTGDLTHHLSLLHSYSSKASLRD